MNKELFDKNRNLDSLRSKNKCLENEIKQLENEFNCTESILNFIKLINSCYGQDFFQEKCTYYNDCNKSMYMIKKKTSETESIQANIQFVEKDINALQEKLKLYEK